jgi:hypothetical protein
MVRNAPVANDTFLPQGPQPYVETSAYPKPRMKLWRTLLKRPRSTRSMAPRLSFGGLTDVSPPDSAAHWGEHIILEDTVTALHRDGTTTTRTHYVTQVVGDGALATWDELFRSYDSRIESHRILTARLMTPDGRWHRVLNKVHTVPAPGTEGNVYGRMVQMRFAPLRPGVIIELEECYDGFKVEAFGPMISNQIYLRTGAPCRRRRFTFAVAKPFQAHYRLHHGAPVPVEREVGGYRVCTWDVQDAEGVEVDEWTPMVRDFVPWVDVSTASSWAPFAEQFRKELEPVQAMGQNVAAIVEEVSRDKTTPLEKAAAAFTYAARTVRYGRPPAELFGRNIRSTEAMLQDLRGDCKDKSALLVQLLRSLRLDARIAVLLTGDSGRTPFLPSARFNHAIVRLEHEGRVHWLDPAAGPFAFGDLPNIDLGVAALVLGKKTFAFEWIRRQADELHVDARTCEGALRSDGSYEFSVKAQLAGETGARMRMQLADRTEQHRLRVLQSWHGADYPGSTGSDFSYDSVDDLAHRFTYRCRARLERVARRIRDLYVVRVPWSSPMLMSGPLTASARMQPLIVPQAYHALDRHVIELPAGALPYAMPDPVRRICDWGGYTLRITVDGARLVCERELRLAGDPVPSERFAEYQDFWRQCSWADGAEIVLCCEDGSLLAEQLGSATPLSLKQAMMESRGTSAATELPATTIPGAPAGPL